MVDFNSLKSILTLPGCIDSVSDGALETEIRTSPDYTNWHRLAVNRANQFRQPYPKDAEAVPLLNHASDANIAQILHEFAVIYGPSVSPGAARLSAFWGILKYLDAFTISTTNNQNFLGLSENAQLASHNQRRVMSEELGVAFSIHQGKRWFADLLTQETGDVVHPKEIQVLDIEEIFTSAVQLPFQGTLHHRRITTNGLSQKRPDYLLTWPGAENTGTSVRAALLESKGSSKMDSSRKQLSGALEQINGLLLDTEHPPGLAVSTAAVKQGGELITYALDPGKLTKAFSFIPSRVSAIQKSSKSHPKDQRDDLREIGYSELSKFAQIGESWRKDGPRPIDVTEPGEFIELGLADLFRRVLMISGDVEFANKWVVSPSSKKYEIPTLLADPVKLESNLGDFYGSRMTMEVNGGDLEISLGLDKDVRSALRDGEEMDGLQAMHSIKDQFVREDLPRKNGIRVESKSTDGTVMTINLKRR